MISVQKNCTFSARENVYSFRERNPQALQRAAQARPIGCFHDEVEVIRENREVDDLQIVFPRGFYRRTERAEDIPSPKGGKSLF